MQVSKLVRAIRYSILILFFSSVPVVISLAGGQKESAPSQQASSAKSADAQLSAAAASQLLVKGKLVVGLMGTYPPYNFLNSSHEVDGFDADIAKEVARRIGLDAQFIPTEWSGMIEGLLKGKFDVVISQMTITDDRKKVMDFSQPYMKTRSMSLYGPTMRRSPALRISKASAWESDWGRMTKRTFATLPSRRWGSSRLRPTMTSSPR